MPATSIRVAVGAVVVIGLGLAGYLGWRRTTPSTTTPRLAASVPEPSSPPATVASRAIPSPPPAAPTPPTPPAAKVPADAGATAAPSFDIVRVEPNGDALLAGRAKPNDKVALVAGGKVVAEAKTDDGGNFVMTPPTLKPGDYALSLREGQGATAKDSKQSVVVSVPASKKQQVVVALAEPGKATQVLSAPPRAEAPSQDPAAEDKSVKGKGAEAPTPASGAAAPATDASHKLAIRSVELENGSGLFAAGEAPPGTDVRVYLNDSRVADVIAAAAGAWSLEVRKGLTAGRYTVRVDALKADKTVAARVEVPFDVPATMGAGKAAERAATPAAPPAEVADAREETERSVAEAPSPPAASAPSPANVVVDALQTELVTRGDNLWRISRKRLGHGVRYTEIYAANVTQIRDPKLVYPGQVFVLPKE